MFDFKSEVDQEDLLNILDVIRAMCILRRNDGAHKHGWVCWEHSIRLRLSLMVSSKTRQHPSALKERICGSAREVKTIKKLNVLKCKSTTHWKIEALLCTQEGEKEV
jgi:hypothetical protein